MNPQEIQDPNMEQPQEMPTDPVSLAKQIQAIEKDMKDGIRIIQEVLQMLASSKSSLDKAKSTTKNNLKKMNDGNE